MAFPNRPGVLNGPGVLPIINLDPRRRGFAGLISDTSLLDVETIVIDKSAGGTAAGLLFRAGTVALVTSVNAKTGTRRGRPAVASDVAAAAGVGKRFVAISFSHDTCDQSGEIYVRNPDQSGVVNVKPANGVNTVCRFDVHYTRLIRVAYIDFTRLIASVMAKGDSDKTLTNTSGGGYV